jgi:hypothetical protein
VDGLLQTPEYATAILGYASDELSEEVRANRMRLRLRRQSDVLDRSDPPLTEFLIDESALHREVGGRAVLAEQLERILDLGSRPRVSVRVIQMTDGAMLASLQAFSLLVLDGDDGGLLYRESFIDDEIVEDVEVVQRYRRRFDEGWGLALGEDESFDVIRARRAHLLSKISQPAGG